VLNAGIAWKWADEVLPLNLHNPGKVRDVNIIVEIMI
jgi:hypothetical protein